MRLLTSSLTLLFLLTFASLSKAQMKVDKYCLLMNQTGNRSVEADASIKLSIGREDSLFAFKDAALLPQLKKVEERTSLIDAFNYMSRLGWQYVGLSAEMNPARDVGRATIGQQYLFKRTFDQSELK